MAKILLGTDYDDKHIFLTKHSFDCGWYWGFGYLGNTDRHFHIQSWLTGPEATDLSKHLKSTKLTQKDWWIIGDLFNQAYSLKECAGIYNRGGAHWTNTGEFGVIANTDKEKELNKDLEKVLDDVWGYINNIQG